jgi:signal transduction histidine kinase
MRRANANRSGSALQATYTVASCDASSIVIYSLTIRGRLAGRKGPPFPLGGPFGRSSLDKRGRRRASFSTMEDGPTTAADAAALLAAEMASTSNAVAGVEDLAEILQRLAARARELVGADYAAVSTFDGSGVLTRFVHVGIDDAVARKLGSPPVGRGLLGDLAQRHRPLRLDDLQADNAFTGWPGVHPDMCAFLGVPIVALGQTIGSLYMTRMRGKPAFTDVEETAASIMALQIVATISTALARSAQSRMVRLQEREQIAHDLHDGTIQALYALGLEADLRLQTCATEETRDALSDVITRVNGIIRDIRSYISMLEAGTPKSAPELVPDLSFVIRQIVPSGVDVVSNVNAPALQELDARDVEDLVYIAREALSNAIRHGKPTKVAVDLRQSAEYTILTVQDNGVGFDTEVATPNMGTITLRTRAERLGAELTIVSVPGLGTTVRVQLPR